MSITEYFAQLCRLTKIYKGFLMVQKSDFGTFDEAAKLCKAFVEECVPSDPHDFSRYESETAI